MPRSFQWLQLLQTHTDRFGDLIEQVDLATPIATCPGWTVLELADHLGGVHQWSAHAVVEGTPDLVPQPAPKERSELAAWYREQAARLLEVLSTRPVDAPAWTMDRADRTAGFWSRRQVHETVMHCWDVSSVAGPAELVEGDGDPDLAWDGIAEVVEVLYPRQVRLVRVEALPYRYDLLAVDLDQQVSLGEGEPVSVRADAEVLLRLLWHRASPAQVAAGPEVRLLLERAVTP